MDTQFFNEESSNTGMQNKSLFPQVDKLTVDRIKRLRDKLYEALKMIKDDSGRALWEVQKGNETEKITKQLEEVYRSVDHAFDTAYDAYEKFMKR